MTQKNEFIPNSFQTPNVLVDRVMPLLKPEEYMALSFAVRHILGWEDKIARRRARISLSMFQQCGLPRSTLRKVLDDLKRAVDTVDLDVPEIEALFETVEEMVTEQTWEYIWEVQIDGVVSNTPLRWDEASRLVGILDGDHNLADGDPLWDALREWIAEVSRV